MILCVQTMKFAPFPLLKFHTSRVYSHQNSSGFGVYKCKWLFLRGCHDGLPTSSPSCLPTHQSPPTHKFGRMNSIQLFFWGGHSLSAKSTFKKTVEIKLTLFIHEMLVISHLLLPATAPMKHLGLHERNVGNHPWTRQQR